jgi:hypothetical protein
VGTDSTSGGNDFASSRRSSWSSPKWSQTASWRFALRDLGREGSSYSYVRPRMSPASAVRRPKPIFATLSMSEPRRSADNGPRQTRVAEHCGAAGSHVRSARAPDRAGVRCPAATQRPESTATEPALSPKVVLSAILVSILEDKRPLGGIGDVSGRIRLVPTSALSRGGAARTSPNGGALFEAANKLRASVESAEYKHLVLGLIFLKYISRELAWRSSPTRLPQFSL